MTTQQDSQRQHNSSSDMERRYLTMPLSMRMDGKDGDKKKRRIGGFALRYGQVYDLGWFSEEIRAGALDAADMTDVVALFNHDPNMPLARSSAGTLTLRNDSEGLYYEFEAPESPNGENVAVAIERGDVKASSWAFTVSDYEWEKKDDKEHRVITKIKRVYDVSPVTYPANPDTSVALRSRPQSQQPAVNNAAVLASLSIGEALAGAAL